MRRFFRHRLVHLVILGSIIGIGLLAIPFFSERPLLLEKARPVAEIQPRLRYERCFDWTTGRDLVLFRPTVRKDRFKLSMVSARTGGEASVSHFNRRMGRFLIGRGCYDGSQPAFTAPSFYLPPELELSPDSKWALLTSTGDTGYVARLDGSEARTSSGLRNFYGIVVPVDGPFWLPSGDGWAAPYGRYNPGATSSYVLVEGVRIHRLEPGQPSRDIIVTGAAPAQAMGVTTDQRLVLLAYQQNRPDAIDLFDVDLTKSPSGFRKRTVKLPGRAEEWGVAISRDGNKLACILRLRIDPPGPHLAQRALRKLGMHSYEEIGLWTHDLRTDRWTLVGRLSDRPKQLAPADPGVEFPYWPKWLPNGRALSFGYRNQIWTVPAP